jgi:hypothetical protein
MPQPTSPQVHVNQLLTNISIAYNNPAYIASELCPDVQVMKQTDIIPKYDQSFWFRDQAIARAPGTLSERGGFNVDTSDTYYCGRFSFGFELPDELRDNADSVFRLDSDATRFVTDKILMKREALFVATLFKTGVWGGGDPTGSGSTNFVSFSDYANSDPLNTIETYKNSTEALMGRETNRGAMGKDVWVKLKWHPDILDTIKYTQRGQVSLELFNSLTEMQWSVGRAIKVTSAEGTAEVSATYARMWGKSMLMLSVPPAPSLLTPAACYNFVWNRVPNAQQYIKTMRNEEAEKDIIEGNGYFAPKLTSKNAGVFLQVVVA